MEAKRIEVKADPRYRQRYEDRPVKKGGEVLAHGLIIVSADGKSQDVSLTSSAAAMSVYNEEAREKAKDKAFRNKAVYDKE